MAAASLFGLSDTRPEEYEHDADGEAPDQIGPVRVDRQRVAVEPSDYRVSRTEEHQHEDESFQYGQQRETRWAELSAR